jgi:hypothetical protein
LSTEAPLAPIEARLSVFRSGRKNAQDAACANAFRLFLSFSFSGKYDMIKI